MTTNMKHPTVMLELCSVPLQNQMLMNSFEYATVASIEWPQVRGDIPVPIAKLWLRSPTTTEEIPVQLESFPSPSFSELDPKTPILMTQSHDLCQRLGLSKTKSEVLTSELKSMNMLAPGVNVTSFRSAIAINF